jgi:glycosyltransferase involved in cell wall biosynthesis
MTSITVIINNYNYGNFLSESIESVLHQTLEADEVIVVDDGSTDNSRDIIKGFGDQILPLFKENGGQASALNFGYAAAESDWILFLDADDWLLPHALEVLRQSIDAEHTKIHFPLEKRSGSGKNLGLLPRNVTSLFEGRPVAYGSLRKPFGLVPTSGNMFSRKFLDRIMPIPEEKYKICADTYLLYSNLEGQLIKRVRDPLAVYRLHGKNAYHKTTQFSLDRDRILRQGRSVVSMVELIDCQGLLTKPAGRGAGDSILGLSELKTLGLALRIGIDLDLHLEQFIECRKLYSLARQQLTGYSGFARYHEEVNLLVLFYAPLFCLPVFDLLESLWKRLYRR